MDNPYLDSLEIRVLSATSLELVAILYEGAIGAVRAAREHLAAGRIHERARAVSKAVNILIELNRSLNLEAGGELSKRLAGLYDFMQRTLLDANFRQTDDGLATTESLLVSLHQAWAAISVRPVSASAAATGPAASASASTLALPWDTFSNLAEQTRVWSA